MADNILEFPVKNEETIMDNIMDALDGTDIGIEAFAALISLPDDQFNILSEMVLDELQKSMNNPTDRYLIQQELLKSGYTAADMADIQTKLMDEMEENLKDQIPQDRIDFLKRAMTIITNMYNDIEGSAKSIVSIPIEVMDYGILPTYAHDGDAAMDIYSPDNYTINPGETVLIKTGLKVAIPRGYALLIQPRSGQSLKTKLRIPNTPGLIDSGYRDEIGVMIENIVSPITDVGSNDNLLDFVHGVEFGSSYTIEKGQRIAQMRLVEVPTISWLKVGDIQEIEGDRGGGFGSTGK